MGQGRRRGRSFSAVVEEGGRIRADIDRYREPSPGLIDLVAGHPLRLFSVTGAPGFALLTSAANLALRAGLGMGSSTAAPRRPAGHRPARPRMPVRARSPLGFSPTDDQPTHRRTVQERGRAARRGPGPAGRTRAG
jgi:hypothetical protein